MFNEQSLPEEIQAMIEAKAKGLEEEFRPLIGTGGYESQDTSIIQDAIIALALGKNVLLKGPTGSGKTKLAETLSAFFQQPMHSVNCSVDLDAESLIGYKTIHNDGQVASIEFIEGPVTKAMKKAIFYILMKSTWRSRKHCLF